MKYLTLVAGIQSLIAAITSSAGAGDANKIPATDSGGKLDISFMPNGVGADVYPANASENLTAGPVNIWNDAGTMKVRKADATAAGKECNGFVTGAVTSGAAATVYLDGTITGMSGLTLGAIHFLHTTSGAVSTTAPSTSGNVVQQIGLAITTTSLIFEPSTPITLAA